MDNKTTHVIFDFDNTLINTLDVAVEVLIEYAQSHSQVLPLDIKAKLANIIDIMAYFNEYLDTLSVKNENREDIFKQLSKVYFNKKFNLIPGVEKLVKHLYKHNIPMVVATNCSKDRYSVHRQQFSEFLSKYFSHVVFAMDDPEVKYSKPNPDIYKVCAERFKSKPESFQHILVVGDSLKGITGAVASGMKTLLINDKEFCDFKGICDKITKICNTFSDFKPESVGLPPYDEGDQ